MSRNFLALLIDDDHDDQWFFELAVSEMDCPVECRFADNGFKALSMLANAEFRPDFIFIDVNMPKMNGMECLTKVRAMERLDQVPVFMYSTSADHLMVEKCLSLGATGLIKKQTSIAETCEKLMNVFESNIFSH